MTAETKHPQPVDRNASIIWARELLDRDPEQWLVLAAEAVSGDSGRIASVAVVLPSGKVVLDMTNPAPADILCRLANLTANREVVVWNLSNHHRLLENCALQNELPLFYFRGHCLMKQFARFVGETDNGGKDYKAQPLPLRKNATGGVAQAKAVLDLIREIAGTHQHYDSADTGDANWSAAFYRPKQNILRSLFKK